MDLHAKLFAGGDDGAHGGRPLHAGDFYPDLRPIWKALGRSRQMMGIAVRQAQAA
jgi:hypothetical protein